MSEKKFRFLFEGDDRASDEADDVKESLQELGSVAVSSSGQLKAIDESLDSTERELREVQSEMDEATSDSIELAATLGTLAALLNEQYDLDIDLSEEQSELEKILQVTDDFVGITEDEKVGKGEFLRSFNTQIAESNIDASELKNNIGELRKEVSGTSLELKDVPIDDLRELNKALDNAKEFFGKKTTTTLEDVSIEDFDGPREERSRLKNIAKQLGDVENIPDDLLEIRSAITKISEETEELSTKDLKEFRKGVRKGLPSFGDMEDLVDEPAIRVAADATRDFRDSLDEKELGGYANALDNISDSTEEVSKSTRELSGDDLKDFRKGINRSKTTFAEMRDIADSMETHSIFRDKSFGLADAFQRTKGLESDRFSGTLTGLDDVFRKTSMIGKGLSDIDLRSMAGGLDKVFVEDLIDEDLLNLQDAFKRTRGLETKRFTGDLSELADAFDATKDIQGEYEKSTDRVIDSNKDNLNIVTEMGHAYKQVQTDLDAVAESVHGNVDSMDELRESEQKLARQTQVLTEISRENRKVMSQKDFLSLAGAAQSEEQAKQASKNVAQFTKEISDLQEAQAKLKDRTKGTIAGIDLEKSTFFGAAQGAENLAEMKDAASSSNRLLAKAAGKTQLAVEEEKNELLDLTATAKDTRGALSNIADSNLRSSVAAQHALDNYEDLNEEQRNNFVTALLSAAGNRQVARAMDDVADETDDANDELGEAVRNLTAGALAAELFSGEFGSLSLNLGAVNVALRNFSRQIPFLITTLGTLASVVGSLASGLVTAGVGFTGLFGAGVIAQAEAFQKNIAGINTTGQGLEAIMSNLKQLFREAIEPLIEAEETIEVFRNTVNALAQEVNFLALTIKNMMEPFLQFSAVAGDILSRGFRQFVEEMAFAFLALEDQLISVIEFFAFGLPHAIEFFTKITARIGDEIGGLISAFFDMSEEIIKFGASIQEGAIPILIDLMSVFERVFEVINRLGESNISQFVAGIVSLMIASKLIGTFSSLILVATGFANRIAFITAQALAADNALEGLKIAAQGLGGGLQTFLTESFGGFKKLGQNISSVKVNMAEMAITTLFTADATDELTEAQTKQIGTMLWQKAVIPQLVAWRNTLTGALHSETAAEWKNTAAKIVGEKVNKLYAGSLGTVIKAVKTSAIVQALATAATWAWNAALAAMNILLGGIPLLIGAVVTAGALLVGVLGNLGAISEGLKGVLSGIIDVMVFMADVLLSVLVPAWNLIIDIIEFALTALTAPIQMLISAFQWIFNGIFGKGAGGSTNFIGALASAISWFAEEVGNLLDILGGLFDFVTEMLAKIPGVDAVDFGGAKVTEEDVRAGAGSIEEKASSFMPGARQNKLEFNENNVSNNYGDINADPENKEQMKRLVKEAMMEANTFRRQSDGTGG